MTPARPEGLAGAFLFSSLVIFRTGSPWRLLHDTSPRSLMGERGVQNSRSGRTRRFRRGMPPMWPTRFRGHWQRHIASHVLAAAGAATTALFLFAKVGEDVFEHESGSFDGAVQRWMLGHRTPWLFRFFTWVTNAGSTLPLLVVTAGICLWLWRAHGRHAASGAIAAPVVAVALFNGIKLFYGRARPTGALHFDIHSYAFPSGHATVSMAAAVTVAYVLWREQFIRGAPAAVVALSIPLLVGFSRTYLDVHWATDVLGGWCVGLFVAGIAAVIYERLRRDADVVVTEGHHPTASLPSPSSSA